MGQQDEYQAAIQGTDIFIDGTMYRDTLSLQTIAAHIMCIFVISRLPGTEIDVVFIEVSIEIHVRT